MLKTMEIVSETGHWKQIEAGQILGQPDSLKMLSERIPRRIVEA